MPAIEYPIITESVDNVESNEFQLPPVYEGIDVFSMTQEELKNELKEDKRHYQNHIDWLELSRRKLILDGLDLEDPKIKYIDNCVLTCERAILEIYEVLETDQIDKLAVYQMSIKHIAIMNEVKDLENELDLEVTYGQEAIA